MILGIFSFLLIFGIVIVGVGGAIWIWKNKNWSKLKKAAITIILAAGVFIVVFISVVGISYFVYSTGFSSIGFSIAGSNIGEIDYDKVISNAKTAGYKVDGPYYGISKQKIGLHPPGIKELDERFGEEYRVLSSGYFYNEKVYFSAEIKEGSTEISFINEPQTGYFATFMLNDLPPDEWIVEKFMLMFDISEQESRGYLALLKDSISKGPETSGKIIIRKEINIAAVYSNLNGASSNSSISLTGGFGDFKETFYSGDKKTGVFDFLVPNIRIIVQDNDREYTIRIDPLGGVAPEIKLSAREEIPEEEYRRIFKDMFVNLGLPPEKVDKFGW